MFSSEASSRDTSRTSGSQVSNPSNRNGFKHVSAEGESLKTREYMGSDFFQNQSQHSSGLTRYRSAPTAFLTTLLDSAADSSTGRDESAAFFSALMDGPRDVKQKNSDSGTESEVGGAAVGSYSVGMENNVRVNLSIGDRNRNCSNLVRPSSSHAGFFNGFSGMREAGNLIVHNQAEASSSTGALSNYASFLSGPYSSSRFLPSIPENSTESIGTCSPETDRSRNGNREVDVMMFSNFNGLDYQDGETRKRSSGLVHHLSSPETSGGKAVVENILHFQPETTVPCRMRAQRGCATHPRSIAERNRRTRISEKLKKLQGSVPNMDKQTNTADMLEMAVEYIKDLQKQVQTLKDDRAKCVCSSEPQRTSLPRSGS